MNSRHKIGLGKPQKHKLGLRSALQDHQRWDTTDRILREHFWLPARHRSAASIRPLSASGAEPASCAVRAKKPD